MTRSRFPFIPVWPALAVLAIWILSTAWLIVRFRGLDSDSIMYGLPLAFSKGPFSLAIPWIGSFPPYSESWGHHWPGAVWLRGAIFAVIPFERIFDISLLLALQMAAAWLIGALVWDASRSRIAAFAGFLIIASDRVLITGIQLHRFEAPAVLALVLLFCGLARTAGMASSRSWLIASAIGAFAAACTHPFAMLVGAGLTGLGVVDWIVFRNRRALSALIPPAAFGLGLGALAIYYFAVPGAWPQFHENLFLQNSFNQASRLIMLSHLVHYRGMGHALWLLAAAGFFIVPIRLWRDSDPLKAFVAWAMPLAALAIPAIFFLTRSVNNSYLVLGTPFAAALVATAAGLVAGCSIPRGLRAVALGVIALLALGFFTVYPYRWLQFFKAGMPDFPRAMNQIVEKVPAGSRLYIPPPLWDASRAVAGQHDVRLWTFCIASPLERRVAYEKLAYSDTREGDYLIVDRLATRRGDPWGILPTFEIFPPDERFWTKEFEEIRKFPGAGNDFGYDLVLYRFKGGKWDPATSPRRMEGN